MTSQQREAPVQSDGVGLTEVLRESANEILSEWVHEQVASRRPDSPLDEDELRRECGEFLKLLPEAARRGNVADTSASEWSKVREFLVSLSRSRGLKGFSPSETATFVFSLKNPVFARIRARLGSDPQALFEAIWGATQLFDKLGLLTTEAYQKAREEVITRQQREMLELSTPVVKLWDGILALPMIGTLDSGRTQVVMESLLERIVETGSQIAIIDITGVPTVDTLVAQHLLKTVTAARLMGAECIVSGVRPQIAQTIVHMGVDLGDIVTKATLADAFALALKRMGLRVAGGEGQDEPWTASRS